jgi:hypothetical protein
MSLEFVVLALWGALSDERPGLSFDRVRVTLRLTVCIGVEPTSSWGHNGSLDTWTVVNMTATKFKPFVFPVSGFAMSNIANVETEGF